MNYHLKQLKEVNPQLCQQLKRFCYDLNGCCQTVHRDLGPYLNEYIYQDALEITLQEQNIQFEREYYFSIGYHGHTIKHKHYVDFFAKDKVLIECKAIEALGVEQRQQLWNYMRLAKVRIGILYNFAPIRDQSEHYYLDANTDVMYYF